LIGILLPFLCPPQGEPDNWLPLFLSTSSPPSLSVMALRQCFLDVFPLFSLLPEVVQSPLWVQGHLGIAPLVVRCFFSLLGEAVVSPGRSIGIVRHDLLYRGLLFMSGEFHPLKLLEPVKIALK